MSIKPVFLSLVCVGMLTGATAFHFALADDPAPQSTAAVETVEAQPPYLPVPASLEFVGGSMD